METEIKTEKQKLFQAPNTKYIVVNTQALKATGNLSPKDQKNSCLHDDCNNYSYY